MARRRARRGAGGAAAGGGALRAALRPRPVDPYPLHHRRHDRQQRLRPARPRLRPDRRQRRGAGSRDRRPASGSLDSDRADSTAQTLGRRLHLAWSPHILAHHPDRVRPVRPPGLGLQPGAPAAGEPFAARPVSGRHRGHPSGDHPGHRAAGRRRPAQDHDRARLPDDGRRGGCGARRCCRTARLALEGLDRRHHRRGQAHPGRRGGAAAAARRRLDVRRTGRRRPWPSCGAGGCPGRRLRPLDGRVVSDPAQALALWKIREDGAGLAGVSLARPAYPGWEDAAVPPERLGAYLRDFDALLGRPRLRRPALRALRRRLRARADRLPAHRARRCRALPDFVERGGQAGRGLRRVDVGRARRRAGPLARCCRPCTPPRHWAVRPGQGAFSTPRTCSTPVSWSTPAR